MVQQTHLEALAARAPKLARERIYAWLRVLFGAVQVVGNLSRRETGLAMSATPFLLPLPLPLLFSSAIFSFRLSCFLCNLDLAHQGFPASGAVLEREENR